MKRKTELAQALARRRPAQARAQQKVELILEAAVRILDREGAQALTTNRIAELAGVSIGTVYQYFADKQSILDALAQRELQAIAVRVMESLTGPAPAEPGGRVRAVVRAVLEAFGGRTRVQRWLLQSATASLGANPLVDLHTVVLDLLTSTGVVAHDRRARTLTPAQGFVIVHAFAGVLRGVLADTPRLPAREIEDALVELLLAAVVKESDRA